MNARRKTDAVGRDIAIRVVKADKERYISGKTIEMSVSLLSQVCDKFQTEIMEAEKNKDRKRLEYLLFLNAILVYETNDFVLKQYESFHVVGYEQLREVYQEVSQKFQMAYQNIKTSLEEARKDRHLKPEVREQVERAAIEHKNAVDYVKKQWDELLDKVTTANNTLQETIHNEISNVKALRNIALNQVNIMALASLTGLLKSSANSLTTTVKTLQGMRLVPLTTERLDRLINF
jgi:predicted nucleic acid-binding protein